MRRFRGVAIAAALLTAATAVHAQSKLPVAMEVIGTVSSSARPIADALIIALDIQSLDVTRTWSGRDGSFVLPALRAGVHKIIAVKQGFEPAIKTLLPTHASQKIAMRLAGTRGTKPASVSQEIWELRGSLPPDILRELDFALRGDEEEVAYEVPRFRGEMFSLTGVTNQTANPAFAQTSLGVQGRIGDTWQVGVQGNLQRFEDPTDDVRFGTPLAESSVMSMEVSSSPTEAYRVASTKSSWMVHDGDDGQRQADVRAHNFEWRHGLARVEVRYFEQDNLFSGSSIGSNLIEVGGAVPVLQTRRNDLGVAIRVTQESVDSTPILRTADVSANGTLALVPSLILHYGLSSHIGMQGQELAPRTGAEWKLTENVSVIGSALYKVVDRDPSTLVLPALVFWAEDSRVLPRYAYTIGLVNGKDSKNRFSAIATVSAIDEPLRMVFAEAQSHFWDGLYVDAGDLRRDVRLAWRREFGNTLALDVATAAGSATSTDPTRKESEKIYVTGDLQSTFSPTRTTLAVSYREIQQPNEQGDDQYYSERINVRMAQSLYLPIDIKLLLGLELARAENSPYVIETLTPEGRSKKYIGGLALNF